MTTSDMNYLGLFFRLFRESREIKKIRGILRAYRKRLKGRILAVWAILIVFLACALLTLVRCAVSLGHEISMQAQESRSMKLERVVQESELDGLAARGASYFFENVRNFFEQDDLTVINMEGTLTEETAREYKQFAFKGTTEFVDILATSSVEVTNMANNHSFDYGVQSFRDTVQTPFPLIKARQRE